MLDGKIVRWLMATSSLAALLTGASDNAQAFPNIGSVSCDTVANTTFSGNIFNTGTISPLGINVSNSIINNGDIIDTGTIAGGINIDSQSKINPGNFSIELNASAFVGGISNAGSIGAISVLYLWRVRGWSHPMLPRDRLGPRPVTA